MAADRIRHNTAVHLHSDPRVAGRIGDSVVVRAADNGHRRAAGRVRLDNGRLRALRIKRILHNAINEMKKQFFLTIFATPVATQCMREPVKDFAELPLGPLVGRGGDADDADQDEEKCGKSESHGNAAAD